VAHRSKADDGAGDYLAVDQQQQSLSPPDGPLTTVSLGGDDPHSGPLHPIPESQQQHDEQVVTGLRKKVRRNLWRDFLILLVGCIVLTAVGFVEDHSADQGRRKANDHGIIDTGFMLTRPMHTFLSEHRHWNDALALLNSIVLLLPTLYGMYTICIGDYSLLFRHLFTQMLRAFCGWFTYLPPSAGYLESVRACTNIQELV